MSLRGNEIRQDGQYTVWSSKETRYRQEGQDMSLRENENQAGWSINGNTIYK